MEGLVVQLVILAVFGAITASIATTRGRSGVAWFFIGAFLGCIGLILVLVLPNLKIQAEREARIMRENRRLRERMRKDRMVSDLRHHQNQRRFAVHDAAIGVDTAEEASARIGAASPPPIPEGASEASRIEETRWHYIETSEPEGPIDFSSLRAIWKEGRLKPTSYVWTQGMKDWKPISEVPELEALLDA